MGIEVRIVDKYNLTLKNEQKYDNIKFCDKFLLKMHMTRKCKIVVFVYYLKVETIPNNTTE